MGEALEARPAPAWYSREAEPGVVWKKDGLRVTMFAVDHAPVAPAVGYKFEYNGKSVVVSGDTKKTPAIVEMARGADLLVHEVVDRATIEGAMPMIERASPRRAAMTRDMMSHHTTTLEAAEIARDAGVKKLALTHLVPTIPPTEQAEASFVRGMAAIYPGPIVVGRDGMTSRCRKLTARSAPVPSPTPAASESPAKRKAGGGMGLELLHLAGLSALSVAQPTYALIAANPQFLSAHAVDGWRLGLLVAALSLGPPLAAAALEVLALAVGARVRAAVHSLLVGSFLAILVLEALTLWWPTNGGWWALAVAAAAGAASTIGYRRSEAIYTLATFLSVSTLVAPAAFLLDGRVRGFLTHPADPTLFDVEVGNPVPLVVVVFDEVPLSSLLDEQGLAIDATLFPSFSRLAATSHWFRNATTTGTFTELAVPSLHNGRYAPSDHQLTADLETIRESLHPPRFDL